MNEEINKQFNEFVNSLDEFDVKKEDHKDDDSQMFFLMSDFILDIIALRKKQHISQKEVADRMGTKQASISRFENFNTKPKLEYLYRIAKAVDGELYVTPNGEYTYTVPEEYRDAVDKLAARNKSIPKELIAKLMRIVLDEVAKFDELIQEKKVRERIREKVVEEESFPHYFRQTIENREDNITTKVTING